MEARLVEGVEAAAELQELRAGAIAVEPMFLADEATGEPVAVALRGELGLAPWFAGYMRRALERGQTAGAVSLTVFAGPTAGGIVGVFALTLYDGDRRRRLHLLVDGLETPRGRVLLGAVRRFRAVELWPYEPPDGVPADARLPFRVGEDVATVCAQARLLAG